MTWLQNCDANSQVIGDKSSTVHSLFPLFSSVMLNTSQAANTMNHMLYLLFYSRPVQSPLQLNELSGATPPQCASILFLNHDRMRTFYFFDRLEIRRFQSKPLNHESRSLFWVREETMSYVAILITQGVLVRALSPRNYAYI